jgi:hypothetical protein
MEMVNFKPHPSLIMNAPIKISKEDLDWTRQYVPDIDDYLETDNQLNFDDHFCEGFDLTLLFFDKECKKPTPLWYKRNDIRNRYHDNNPYLDGIFNDDGEDLTATPEEFKAWRESQGYT